MGRVQPNFGAAPFIGSRVIPVRIPTVAASVDVLGGGCDLGVTVEFSSSDSASPGGSGRGRRLREAMQG